MSASQAPAQKPVISITEMDGRVAELERQRNEALTRCATLSGHNALLRRTLTEACGEIDRLNGLVPPPPDHDAETRAQASTTH